MLRPYVCKLLCATRKAARRKCHLRCLRPRSHCFSAKTSSYPANRLKRWPQVFSPLCRRADERKEYSIKEHPLEPGLKLLQAAPVEHVFSPKTTKAAVGKLACRSQLRVRARASLRRLNNISRRHHTKSIHCKQRCYGLPMCMKTKF